MTLAAVTGGLRARRSRAFLHATSAGQALYESIGFTSVTEYGAYTIENT